MFLLLKSLRAKWSQLSIGRRCVSEAVPWRNAGFHGAPTLSVMQNVLLFSLSSRDYGNLLCLPFLSELHRAYQASQGPGGNTNDRWQGQSSWEVWAGKGRLTGACPLPPCIPVGVLVPGAVQGMPWQGRQCCEQSPASLCTGLASTHAGAGARAKADPVIHIGMSFLRLVRATSSTESCLH